MGHLLLATSTTSSSSSSSFLPILLIVVVLILVYYTFSRRSRARQAAQMNTSLVPGQPVRTTSGMYGTISSVEGDDVIVEVAPGVHVRMMKRVVVPVAGGGPSTNGSAPAAGRSETADERDDDDAGDADDSAESADESPRDRKL